MKRTIVTGLLLFGAFLQLAAAQSWTSNGPIPRYGQSAVFDSLTKQMIVFGGFSGANGQTLDADVWRLLPSASLSGLQNWVAVHPAGTLPPGRGGHVAGDRHGDARTSGASGGALRGPPKGGVDGGARGESRDAVGGSGGREAGGPVQDPG